MTAARRVALATDAFGRARDAELPVLIAALRERGVDAVAADWDDPAFDWAARDAVVIRSTWDYPGRPAEFLAWAARVGGVTALHNPVEVVRWNSDKTYLTELAAAGVPTVPTRFIAPGEPVELTERGEIVVKPSVSAGARDSARYTPAQRGAAEAHVRMLHEGGATAMVQPYLERIVDGERALVFLGGEFSHAMRKGPVLTDTGRVDNARIPHPDLVGHLPDAAELAVARAALTALATTLAAGPLLYARVDLALDTAGAPVVMELELIEPNLFLTATEGGVDRFVEAVTRL
ncbi:RimK family alpha-L-glutamate ligase [Streptomyces goshikiensis]|uniref:ATP-grasp domain-containing protein n=1 Tax=Streptomyces goshikiensis TaxID=1942 RepID=UPI0036C9AFDC